MGRVNKTTDGVFVNIVGTSKERSAYNQFITRNFILPDQDGEYCLANYVTEYSNKVSQHKMDIQQLADLEVVIMQIQALSNLIGNVKLYTVRNTYIYGRCPSSVTTVISMKSEYSLTPLTFTSPMEQQI